MAMMSHIRELPMPVYVGEPRAVSATCSECGKPAKDTIQFVANSVDTRTSEPLGCWEPAVYKCEAGHYTMESET
jgi:hypothetical protein